MFLLILYDEAWMLFDQSILETPKNLWYIGIKSQRFKPGKNKERLKVARIRVFDSSLWSIIKRLRREETPRIVGKIVHDQDQHGHQTNWWEFCCDHWSATTKQEERNMLNILIQERRTRHLKQRNVAKGHKKVVYNFLSVGFCKQEGHRIRTGALVCWISRTLQQNQKRLEDFLLTTRTYLCVLLQHNKGKGKTSKRICVSLPWYTRKKEAHKLIKRCLER